MKVVSLILLILISFGCSENANNGAKITNEKQDYTLTIDQGKLKEVKNLEKPVAGFVCVAVPVVLKNNGMATLTYWDMSCSTEEIFTTDNKDVRIMGSACEKNVPRQFLISPGKTSEVHLTVCIKKGVGIRKFRVGVTLHAESGSFFGKDIGKLLSNPKDLIWSNVVIANNSPK